LETFGASLAGIPVLKVNNFGEFRPAISGTGGTRRL
jgi:hypothetical protein